MPVSARAYQNAMKGSADEKALGDKCQRCGGSHKFIKCPERRQDMEIIGQIQTTKAALANPTTKPASTKITAPGILDSFWKAASPTASAEVKQKTSGKLGVPLLGDTEMQADESPCRTQDQDSDEGSYQSLPKETLRQRKGKG